MIGPDAGGSRVDWYIPSRLQHSLGQKDLLHSASIYGVVNKGKEKQDPGLLWLTPKIGGMDC
jgi:hypothetical protein